MSEDADAAAEEPIDDTEATVDAKEGASLDGENAASVDADDDTPVEDEAAQSTPEPDAEDDVPDQQAEDDRPLIERIEDQDEELAEAIREERADYEARIDDLEGKLARKQADFQNFKKRQQKKLDQQRERATEKLVERLLPVRDNLARALEQDADTDIREGVEGTLRELDRVLADEGVERIEPEPGEDPDPERHEVMMRVESDQPAGTIEELYRPGYEMGERVVRTAQVTVSEE